MSVLTQVGGFNLDQLWPLGAIPAAVALDLALGDLPGRSYPVRWMNRLIEVAEGGVRKVVKRLGGGRGGDLFGGFLLAWMVVGTASSVTFLVLDLADSMGGVVTLGVRAALIAAGLAIRSTGDPILHAAEAGDRATSLRWLEAVGGRAPTGLDQLGVDRVCVAAVGEKTSSSIVAPLFWFALGGPTAMWGFLAIRSLREALLARGDSKDLAGRVPVVVADLAESAPSTLTWLLVVAASGILRLDFARAFSVGWRAGRSHPQVVPIWGQAALAGALGVQLSSGRVFARDRAEPHPWVGDSTRPIDALTVVRAVRIMQITAILAAGLTLVVAFFGASLG